MEMYGHCQAGRCFGLSLGQCGCHGWRGCLFPACSPPGLWEGCLSPICILPQCSWGSPLEANSSLAPLQQVGMLCESTHTGNQADNQTTAKMQRVDLSACLTDSAGQHRHTGTRAPFGFAHPSKQRHTGTQALFGLLHPSQGHGGPAAMPNISKNFAHKEFFTRLPDTSSVLPTVSRYYQIPASHFILLPNHQIRPNFPIYK